MSEGYAKEETTVELFEALVPIPITVRGENVRVLKRKNEYSLRAP